MTQGRLKKAIEDCLDRREFLKLMGLLGIGIATPAVASSLDSIKFDKELHKVTRTRLLTLKGGPFVTITVLDPSKDKAHEAVEKAFSEIKRLTEILNRHAEDTPIGHLNKEGVLKDVNPEIDKLLTQSEHFYRLSQGAFNITIKPILDLYVKSFNVKGKAPDIQEIKDVLRLVSAKNIYRGSGEIRFLNEGMGITLDGIAKGYIVDSAAHVLKNNLGIKHALIDAGGDIKAIGDRGRGKPWRIAIRDPKDKKKNLGVITLIDGAVATSGNYEVYFDKEKMFHHIIDPKTGHSPRSTTSVSIFAKRVMDADALSTSAFVFDPVAGKEFIDSIPGAECLIVDSSGLRVKSKGWPIA